MHDKNDAGGQMRMVDEIAVGMEGAEKAQIIIDGDLATMGGSVKIAIQRANAKEGWVEGIVCVSRDGTKHDDDAIAVIDPATGNPQVVRFKAEKIEIRLPEIKTSPAPAVTEMQVEEGGSVTLSVPDGVEEVYLYPRVGDIPMIQVEGTEIHVPLINGDDILIESHIKSLVAMWRTSHSEQAYVTIYRTPSKLVGLLLACKPLTSVVKK